jgi:hypothetical protein
LAARAESSTNFLQDLALQRAGYAGFLRSAGRIFFGTFFDSFAPPRRMGL